MTEDNNNLTPDFRIRDAVSIAIKKARLFSTNMAILKDGKVVEVTPDEFERGLSDSPQEPLQK